MIPRAVERVIRVLYIFLVKDMGMWLLPVGSRTRTALVGNMSIVYTFPGTPKRMAKSRSSIELTTKYVPVRVPVLLCGVIEIYTLIVV